ncbi:MAG: aminotransferase class I/II-fold pyridoxal phosphate-dependent enzyme, partial [Pirellulales bacterium]|nr:aminotransferase class I/II-fold pyridoxal phosphate-dependent enzyme [Pirellulales bacterium]
MPFHTPRHSPQPHESLPQGNTPPGSLPAGEAPPSTPQNAAAPSAAALSAQSAAPLSRRASRAAQQPIGRLMQMALERPQLISLAAGFVSPDSLPVDCVREAVDRLLTNDAAARAALQYGTTAGHPLLREALLARQLALDGLTAAEARLGVEQVVVTAGSNELLHLLVDILCDEGDIVLCGAPSYFVFLGILGHLGVRSVGVECDAEGLIPEALHERLRFLETAGELERVRAVYVVSYFDNPRGISVAAARRAALVETVRRWSRHGRIRLIEDMAYRLLRYEGVDLPSLRALDPDGQTVIATDT